MAKLEEITVGAIIRGVMPGGPVTVVGVKWIGDLAMELTYKDASGKPDSVLLYRDSEPDLEIVGEGNPWSFDGDGALFRLIGEARRIRLAYLFDPPLAVHTSLVEPLPHQIMAVYGEMLPRQPLRFLLADDPGAGKTIMAGLLIKELMIRGDVQRCLVVCPGNLVEQWQDELFQKFQLPFEIMTNQGFEAARTGNWFQENGLAICRLDKLSRDEDVQAKLKATDWDLVVCDEAHKMSAHFFGGEVSYTKRYRLGQLLSSLTRHFLLLTATPHSGKEEDFQLFMALLDGDRFEGRFRDGVHTTDASDLMRRMVKEDLVKFDGSPLFPERKAYTLDAYQTRIAESGCRSAESDVKAKLPEAYRLLLVPDQDDPRGEVSWREVRLQGQDSLAARASRKMRDEGFLLVRFGGVNLRHELDRVPLWRGDHVGVRQLQEDFATYLYLPRLRDDQVLLGAIDDGLAKTTWQSDTFAYAQGWDEAKQRYQGLTAGEHVDVSADGSSLVVKPDVALRQMQGERVADTATTGTGYMAGGGIGPGGGPTITAYTGREGEPKVEERAPKRFHGSVKIDPVRINRDVPLVSQEVIQHLLALKDAGVEVTLEITAHLPDGANQDTIRTVCENCRTLGFEAYGFKEE